MKKAFTLIELLVVIAIIAILAAILFPVFAQAKSAAKKTTTLSNAKQLGTAQIMYGTDNDDFFPLAWGVRPQGANPAWFINGLTPFPANAVALAPWNDPIRQATQAALMWANSTLPYNKSFDLYRVPVAREIPLVPIDVIAPGVAPTAPALTMNGFMHNMSSSEVTNPSAAILLWTGQGNIATPFRALTTPSLNCNAAWVGNVVPACRFNPGGRPQEGSTGNNWAWSGRMSGVGGSVWTFERQAIYVRTDGSAKVGNAGRDAVAGVPTPPPNTIDGALSDPYHRVDVGGTVPLGAWISSCSTPGVAGSAYWCFFRPDRDR